MRARPEGYGGLWHLLAWRRGTPWLHGSGIDNARSDKAEAAGRQKDCRYRDVNPPLLPLSPLCYVVPVVASEVCVSRSVQGL